jgi:hypothetical protein
MEMCKDHGVAVWDDEVQSFGRTEQMFAFEHFDLGEYVDVFCVGKMTQACATLYTDEYNPKPGLLSGTFTGRDAGVRRRQAHPRAPGVDGGLYGDDGLIGAAPQGLPRAVDALKARSTPTGSPRSPSSRGTWRGVGGMMRFTPFGGEKDRCSSCAGPCTTAG